MREHQDDPASHDSASTEERADTDEPVMKRLKRRPLTIREILAWADAHRQATGCWPTAESGGIIGAKFETWAIVDNALRAGLRGLPGESSLARLLAEQRGVRNPQSLPSFTIEQILAWADAHYERTGRWPINASGPILDSSGDKWNQVDQALWHGSRGLPGGSSLAKLLAEHRGVRNRMQLPPLTEEAILDWADAHYRRTGSWPSVKSGPIMDVPGETWAAIDFALQHGRRGLPGGSSLTLLLAEKRNVRNYWTWPNLSVEGILRWADAHHARTGKWPHRRSGSIPEASRETWVAVDSALHRGMRGLPGGSTLAKLLAGERGVRNHMQLPPLSIKTILTWADAHFQRTGQWPTSKSGKVVEAPDETWSAVNAALHKGGRGLRGESSLARLLAEYRGKRNNCNLPPLSLKKIMAWADAHHDKTGRWPNASSGVVQDAPGENWRQINAALRRGQRGLAGGSSLARLLARKRGARDRTNLSPLTEVDILTWADLHLQRTGKYPLRTDGAVANVPGETWAAIDSHLQRGTRGLPVGSSLAKLLVGAGRTSLSPLTEAKILHWSDLHFQRTGKHPRTRDGQVADAPGNMWATIDFALRYGKRGLPGGSTLARLLAEHRGVRNSKQLPPLTEEDILHWADLHFQRTGKYPFRTDGAVANVPGETWAAIDFALQHGRRGLPGGTTLARLLAEHRGVRNHMQLPPLTEDAILAWADAHQRRTGAWPTRESGSIADAPGETWRAVEAALRRGKRGLPAGMTLAKLLARAGKRGNGGSRR